MSRMNPTKVALAVTLGLTVSAQISAQESTTVDETIVVTAAGYEQVVTNAPASVTVLNQEDLASRYYRDVTDALTSVPGVVVTGGGDTKDISIRGMGSKYTLILVDGKRLSSRQTRPNSDGPGIEAAWLPPLEAIERIEIIRGPMSTLYGSEAMGGVINIITKKTGQTWSGKVQLSTVLQENRDSGDEQNVNFFASGPLTDSLSLQVYGQNQHRDEDNIEYGFEDKTLRSIGSKLIYQLSENQELAFSADITQQRREGTAGQSVTEGDDDSLNEYNRTSFSLSHKGDWGSIGRSDSYIQREKSDNDTREMFLTNTMAKSVLVTPFESNTLSIGIQGEKAELEDRTGNTGGSVTELDNSQMALFMEDEWRVLDNVALTFGGRYDYNEDYGSHFSPRVYSVWNLNETWTLKGGVSTGFKAPDLRQASDDWISVSRGGNIHGNSQLDPETSVSEEINVIYNGQQGMQASLGLFNSDFKNKISSVSCPDSICTEGDNQWGNSPRYYTNVDKAVTRGVEASLDLPLGDDWDWKSSYTYTYSKQKSGDYEGMPLEQLPKHLFTTQLNWQTTDLMSSWAKVTYHGKESEPSSSRETLIAPSYTFVDAGITYALTSNTSVKAAIYNLFDEDVTYEEYGYVEDGRRYWVGLDVAF